MSGEDNRILYRPYKPQYEDRRGPEEPLEADEWELVEEPLNAEDWELMEERLPPFRETRCCVCGGELGEPFAVLFRAETGAEARIDLSCCASLCAALESGSRREVSEACAYLLSRRDAVDPRVAERLTAYAGIGAERLRRGGDS